MKTHAAAVANAAEYDKRKGGRTMPPDVKAVWPKRMNDKKKDRK